MQIEANLVDIFNKEIYPAKVVIKDDTIISIQKTDKKYDTFILPGFVDAHIHIESSMLIPSQFAKLATKHGSVATVSDPHEIANVLGIDGIEFMIKDAKKSGFKVYFGASPCVPATPFETNGATLSVEDIDNLLSRDDIYYLSEVMNFPGVINGDKDMLDKIKIAKKYNKPIDGHSPALTQDDLQKYIDAGISTDHEAFTYEEAKEKLQRGIKIQIREGSAAKNYEALHPLIDEFYEDLMFCSDDKHPNELYEGHINELVKRSIAYGYDLYKVLQIASYNPVKHYNIDVGMLRIGDKADFIEVKNLQDFEVLQTVINGKVVYDKGKSYIDVFLEEKPNRFDIDIKTQQDFKYREVCKKYRVINAINKQLITQEQDTSLVLKDGIVQTDTSKDILLISVTNRYNNAPVALSFVHGFGLKEGAIASSVAHDSHNIISVGCDAFSMALAVNAIIKTKGGISAVNSKGDISCLALPVAGLMSSDDANIVAKRYKELDRYVKDVLGSKLDAPFMTLSFMALLVILDIKLSDKGLFDGNSFHFIKECAL